MMGLFGGFEAVSSAYPSSLWYVNGLMGGICGGVSAWATTPFDVIKTRVMASDYRHMKLREVKEVVYNQPANLKAVAAGTRSMTTMALNDRSIRIQAKLIYNQHGLKGFWRGATARSGWWFCVCSVFFPSYTHLKWWFAQQ
jgi:solute carrier family 25 S-adenosylmethionine transporter 26